MYTTRILQSCRCVEWPQAVGNVPLAPLPLDGALEKVALAPEGRSTRTRLIPKGTSSCRKVPRLEKGTHALRLGSLVGKYCAQKDRQYFGIEKEGYRRPLPIYMPSHGTRPGHKGDIRDPSSGQ